MQTWMVSGRIEVRHGLARLRRNFGASSPMAGARVHVSGRKRIAGVWANWGPFGDAISDAEGHFRVINRRDALPRQFRVEVKLKSRSFVIYGENKNALSKALAGITVVERNPFSAALEGILSHTGRATLKAAVHEVHRDAKSASRRHGQHNLGTLQLRSGVAQAHGDAWVLFQRMAEFLRRNRVPFRGSIGLKYPHNNKLIGNRIEESYCNPLNKVCYIISNGHTNQFDTKTLLHELMHAWAFRNTTGEWKMTWQMLTHGSHLPGRIGKTYIPFHEAFALWAAIWMERAILPNGARTPISPLSRQGLINEGIEDVNELEHYLDGWTSVFNLLTTSNLDRYDFNGRGRFARESLPERCTTPRIPLIRVLRSFRANPRLNLDQMRARDMKLRPFLRRLAMTDGSFSEGEAEAYRQLQNPNSTAQPWELLC